MHISKIKKVLFANILLPFDLIRSMLSRPRIREHSGTATPETSSLYSIKVETLEGKPLELSKFAGRKMLIVNVASKCGKTPQYSSLQKIQEEMSDRVQVLAFPSGDFGAQEFEHEDQIILFCQRQYHITFPVFGKTHVRGRMKNLLFKWLSDPAQNGWNNRQPVWNFTKYLVDENGFLLAFFPPAIDPLDKQIISLI